MANEDAKKLCFVVGPIGKPDSEVRIHSDWLLAYVIGPVMEKFPGYTVKRADQSSRPGMIDTQIITALRDADLVIADLSNLNPNAFYEIGIRHMFGKPIVHMQLETEEIPFDVQLYSAIKFSLRRPSDIEVAKTELERHVKDAVDPKHVVDNPVTRVLGREKSAASAMPEVQALSAALNSLAQEVAFLKQRTIADERRYFGLSSASGISAVGTLSDTGTYVTSPSYSNVVNSGPLGITGRPMYWVNPQTNQLEVFQITPPDTSDH